MEEWQSLEASLTELGKCDAAFHDCLHESSTCVVAQHMEPICVCDMEAASERVESVQGHTKRCFSLATISTYSPPSQPPFPTSVEEEEEEEEEDDDDDDGGGSDS